MNPGQSEARLACCPEAVWRPCGPRAGTTSKPPSRGAPGYEQRAALIDTAILSRPFVEVLFLSGTERQCENIVVEKTKKTKTKNQLTISVEKRQRQSLKRSTCFFFIMSFISMFSNTLQLTAFPGPAETLCVLVPLGL